MLLSRSKRVFLSKVRSFAAIPTLNVPLSMPATLPELSFGYGDLEPILPARLMEVHHGKHHAAYVANYNKATEAYKDYASKSDIENMMAAHKAVTFNAGGHINHSIFWSNLAPVKEGGGQPPEGELLADINAKYGSLDTFIERFNAATATFPGSGWGWLAYSKETGIHIKTTPNQDIMSSAGLVPLLAIDVWEHAYYIEYENRRPDYLKNIWKIVNWKNVADRYAAAKAAK
uniref:Superoxide dismutase n=1 Tax=Hirondellea gigas TaxID=1518452 RepID=A0A2P2IBH3_9CRUS